MKQDIYRFSCLMIAAMGLSACAGGDMRTAQKAMQKGDYQTAQANYQDLAEFGIPRANVELGKMYLYGRGVEKDTGKALSYFERAKAAGESPKYVDPLIARTENSVLSQSLRTGSAAQRQQALARLTDKARAGDAVAAFEAARAYEKGWGAAVNGQQAVQYYNEAGKLGLAKGYYYAGMLYKRGKLVPKNEALASQLINMAQKNGYTVRPNNVASLQSVP